MRRSKKLRVIVCEVASRQNTRYCICLGAFFVKCLKNIHGKQLIILKQERSVRPLEEVKQRIIQEFVPGKQVTLAHVIANPNKELYPKLGMVQEKGAIGIMTITPSEGAMIAADVASKAANVSIGFVDRFNGTLVILGDVAAVEAAIKDVMVVLCDKMGFAGTNISKT